MDSINYKFMYIMADILSTTILLIRFVTDCLWKYPIDGEADSW